MKFRTGHFKKRVSCLLLVSIIYATISQNASGPVLPSTLLTALRVGPDQADVNPSDDIDAPIIPVTDTNVLFAAKTKLGLGVVADGVTPVLLHFSGISGDYTITVSNNSANSNPLFYTNIFVLQDGAWANSTLLTIPRPGPPNAGTGFAYLQGLDWSQFFQAPPYKPVMITISAISGPDIVNSVTFEVRPPPIALIHGYAAKSASWTPSFLTNLYNFEPSNFVFAVNYGTSYNNSVNTTAPLNILAQMLDQVLASQVEATLTNWAYTRYDVVGHSQGGVLARMLCQNAPGGAGAFIPTPVVSQQNIYRGRFRRVITIGSPHNGSILLHYILQLRNSYNPLFRLIPTVLADLVQSKFDPFGSQIAQINNPNLPVDQRVKFDCIQTTIGFGLPPGAPYVFVDEYDLLGLSTVDADTVRSILPNGSDGVVDFQSQGAGVGTLNRYISGANIDHADEASFLFGVHSGQSQTTYPLVAQNVVSLLNGSASAFGPFTLPSRLPASEEELIDSLVPHTIYEATISGVAHVLDVSSNYSYSLALPSGVPSGGIITWYCQVFGTNGVSTDGVSVQVNATNASLATMTVNNSVQGSVVLYAAYAAANGVLVFANPVVVVSNPPGATLIGIQTQPPSATLTPGDILPIDIWGLYTNGATSILYSTPGQASYVSSNPNVASIDANGVITMNHVGSATILASYSGFTAQTVIASPTPVVSGFYGTMNANNAFQLLILSTPGVTNIIQTSSNLTNWNPLAVLFNSNGIVSYTDLKATNTKARFYRVMIP